LILKYEGRHNNSGEKSCSINIGCHDCRMTSSKKFERHRYDQESLKSLGCFTGRQ